MNKTQLRILICDDDDICLQVNAAYMESLSKKYSVESTILKFNKMNKEMDDVIVNKKIDIALLDIEMDEVNGIQIAKKIHEINPWVFIIFITNYKEYTADAFRVKAFGYIKKPVEQKEIEQYFQQAIFYVRGMKKKKEYSYLSFKSDNKIVKIRQDEIIYIEKEVRKLVIKTEFNEYKCYGTVNEIEGKLEDFFLRINQGVIINLNEFFKLEKNVIYLRTGEYYNIGRTYMKEVRSKLASIGETNEK